MMTAALEILLIDKKIRYFCKKKKGHNVTNSLTFYYLLFVVVECMKLSNLSFPQTILFVNMLCRMRPWIFSDKSLMITQLANLSHK